MNDIYCPFHEFTHPFDAVSDGWVCWQSLGYRPYCSITADRVARRTAGAADDAAALRRAAELMRERSRRPRSILLAAICRVLEDQAAKIESKCGPMKIGNTWKAK